MTQSIEIVDRGRGLQLSTSRVTIQDLVPYFQEDQTNDEIQRWIPTLTREEIEVARRYYTEHRTDLDEQDRMIRERSSMRRNPDWVEKVRQEGNAKMHAFREKLNANGKNGVGQ